MTNVYMQFETVDEMYDSDEVQEYINLLNIQPDEIAVPEYMYWVPDNNSDAPYER